MRISGKHLLRTGDQPCVAPSSAPKQTACDTAGSITRFKLLDTLDKFETITDGDLDLPDCEAAVMREHAIHCRGSDGRCFEAVRLHARRSKMLMRMFEAPTRLPPCGQSVCP